MVGNCGTEKCRMLQSEKTCFKDGVVAGWRREILREEVVTVVLQNQWEQENTSAPQVQGYVEDRENSQHFQVLQHTPEKARLQRAQEETNTETARRTEGLLQKLWHQLSYFLNKGKRKTNKKCSKLAVFSQSEY